MTLLFCTFVSLLFFKSSLHNLLRVIDMPVHVVHERMNMPQVINLHFVHLEIRSHAASGPSGSGGSRIATYSSMTSKQP